MRIDPQSIFLVLAANCLGLSAHAHAAATFTYFRNSDASWSMSEQTGAPAPAQSDVQMYDNYRDFRPPLGWFGNTLLDSDLRVGGQEIGDDLQLGNFQDGVIDSAGWSFVNLSNVGMQGFRVRFRWYNGVTHNLLGEFTLNTDFPRLINPGERILIQGASGTLRFLRIPVAEQMFYTTEYLETRGIELADAGATYGGPHNVGSSSRFAFNFTTNQQIDLGGSDENLGYFINVFPIPTPSAFAILGLAALFPKRRRRS